ncbi:cholinesterase-like [Haliotis cracherodii]|uniref:cholinesterase-like n=1 Tax=Haliotis cracherodii TaxID=6455 RepID=UPI0039E7AEE1
MPELRGLPGWLTWCVLLITCSKGEYSVVTTSLGPIRGNRTTVLNSTVDIYYGIPYAAPPVGDLRFRRPVPHDPWNTTRDALDMPNSCHQSIDELFDRFEGVDMWNPNTNMSEDCLYLNIWVPRGGALKKAILLWIYGGTFALGTSTLRVYDGKYMAAANDVIVVSINYRIGTLGFLSYGDDAFSSGDDAPGNVGLLDQLMAIKWVRNNADNFGGDVNRITIFGESAGAVSVSMHLLSPLSRDLFNNAMMQSASALCYWGLHTRQMANDRTRALAQRFNCTTTDETEMLKCLRSADPQELSVEAWYIVDFYFDAPFAPVVDKYFLPDIPEKLIARGEIKNTSILLGVNKNEGNYFLLYGVQDKFKLNNPNPLDRDEFLDVVRDVVAPSNDKTKKAVAVEYEEEELPVDRDTYRVIADDISGDRAFKCPTIDFAREMSRINKDIFLYSFEHRVSTNPWPKWAGVMHGYEIEIIFGLPLENGSRYNSDEVDLSRRVMKMWTNFAKYSNPNDANSNNWPRFDIKSQQFVYLNVSKPVTSGRGLRHKQCTFWREIVPLLADPTSPPSATTRCVNTSHSVFPNYTVLFITGAFIIGGHLKQFCA